MKSQSKTLRLVSLLSVLALTALASTAVKAQSIEVGTQLRHVSYHNQPTAPQVVVSGPNYQVSYGAPVPVTRVVYQNVRPVVYEPVRVYDGRYEHRRHRQYNRHIAPVYYQHPVQYVPAPHYVPVQYVAPAPIIVKPAPIYHHRPHWDNKGW